ncbi:MAG TPA: DnaJ domain-containing protein [Bacteroidales bacterium]|nr:DnaJ domain-containing protein [Bacteroidales bacterium]
MPDYYKILELPPDPSVEDIKKAYRRLARLYHPDINHSPDAKDRFILITEAYDFLLSSHEKIKSENDSFDKVMEDWRKYRRDMTRRRASAYARSSYKNFRKSDIYRTTKIFNRTTTIFSFAISFMVILYTVFGYLFRIKHPVPGLDKPSVFAFITLLIIGLVFLAVSFIHMRAYQESNRKKHK